MAQTEVVPIAAIDPKSNVNVRQTGVDANVAIIKDSIARNGYWPESTVAIRPHPNQDSEYQYQHVTGQCRIIAARELDIDAIPASIIELSDDEAIRRSWNENEQRSNLSIKDQAHWTETVYLRFRSDGHLPVKAWQKTATYLGISQQKARQYHALIGLPEDIQEKVDSKTFPKNLAESIANHSSQTMDTEETNATRMRERADWAMNLDRTDRKYAVAAMEDLPANATISDLDAKMRSIAGKTKMKLPEWEIPSALYDPLMKFGESRGITDPQSIVSLILHETLTQKRR